MLHSGKGRNLWIKGQRAEKFKMSLFRHRCWPVLSISTLFVLSLPISATGTMVFVPLSEMSSSCKGVTPIHCLPFYLLGAETFLWISSNVSFNWRLFRLVLFNVKIWSVPYWFVAAITLGTTSDIWALIERVRNEQSYLGTGVKKTNQKVKWYGRGKEKVCSQKLWSIKVKSVIQSKGFRLRKV